MTATTIAQGEKCKCHRNPLDRPKDRATVVNMASKSDYLTLHRYFLNASRNRSLFINQLQIEELDHPHTRIHLDLWYACLFVVIEGWRKERIRDQSVTHLLRQRKKVELLEGCRNAVFHYDSIYTGPRQEKLFKDSDFVDWVTRLHNAIGDYLLRQLGG
jgi:hypothetical protein